MTAARRDIKSWLRRLRRDERGISAIEFAFALPALLLLAVGVTEVGRVVNQAAMVEKGLRAGAYYAARLAPTDYPLSTASETTVGNLVRYGDPTGGTEYLVEGWGAAGADLDINSSTTYSAVDGTELPVVKLTATVPFVPLLPGLLPIPSFNIRLSHEQTLVGN